MRPLTEDELKPYVYKSVLSITSSDTTEISAETLIGIVTKIGPSTISGRVSNFYSDMEWTLRLQNGNSGLVPILNSLVTGSRLYFNDPIFISKTEHTLKFKCVKEILELSISGQSWVFAQRMRSLYV